MTNERLRAAFKRTGLTPDGAARQLEVDPKTVQKWLGGRVPHPRHRWSVCQLVDENEQYLWPGASRSSSGDSGSTEEILQAFPRRASVESSRWRSLIDQGVRQIDILGYTIYFLPEQIPEFVDVLQDKCESGCQVRLVLADPDCEQVRLREEEEQQPITIVARIRTSLRSFEPLFDNPNAEIRLQRAPLYNSIYRFDDEMFVTPHLYATPGHSAPLLHLRRLAPKGMFDRFTSHFDQLWSDCTPVRQDRGEATTA